MSNKGNADRELWAILRIQTKRLAKTSRRGELKTVVLLQLADIVATASLIISNEEVDKAIVSSRERTEAMNNNLCVLCREVTVPTEDIFCPLCEEKVRKNEIITEFNSGDLEISKTKH